MRDETIEQLTGLVRWACEQRSIPPDGGLCLLQAWRFIGFTASTGMPLWWQMLAKSQWWPS